VFISVAVRNIGDKSDYYCLKNAWPEDFRIGRRAFSTHHSGHAIRFPIAITTGTEFACLMELRQVEKCIWVIGGIAQAAMWMRKGGVYAELLSHSGFNDPFGQSVRKDAR
jgi:hypothetical protein